MDIRSIGLLITDIKTLPYIKKLNLVQVSKSIYSEAFSRYDPRLFRQLFLSLLEGLTFLEILELKKLGRFILVDGAPCF